MKKSTRFAITAIGIELFIVVGGFWFAGQAAAGNIGSGGPNPETAARTMEMVGAVTFPLAVVFAMIYFSLKRKGE